MYNLLVAIGCAAVMFALVVALMGWKFAIVPALFVLGVVWFLLARRVGTLVQPELDAAIKLIQEGKLDEGRARIEAAKVKYGPWQFLLSGQLDAQIGMLSYMQMKFDEALPRLEAGSWRNWAALVCIGCIDWRKSRKKEAYARFTSAADASPKEAMTYVVWAVLLERDGQREEALKVLDRGIKDTEGSATLKELQTTLANKKKVDPAALGQNWYQFFPEDYIQQQKEQMLIRGRKDGGATPPPPIPFNRKMRRQQR